MNSTFDIEALRSIGLAPALFPSILALPKASHLAPMRVVQVQRDRFTLHDGRNEHPARALPALTQSLLAEDDVLAVGDWVLAERNAFGEHWAMDVVPPLTRISRRDVQGRRQTLVANVDTALLAMGLDADFNLRRLERYLALARLAGVSAVVVLTKADGCAHVQDRLAEVRAQLPHGVEAIACDAREAAVRQALAPWLGEGQTLVLLGSSGAGKSTLTNTLTAAASCSVQATGSVRGDDSRGRHTTTARSLFRCEGGACIIDTPGLRTLRLDADEARLEAAFDDIASAAGRCRFRDCRHLSEPGCAVLAQVAPERLRSYQKMLRDARRDMLTPQERRERLAHFKSRGRAVHVHMKAKRGE